jgi:hypothetical protein
MLLLSMIVERELPAQELIELIKRVQIPRYEAVHEVVHDVSEGVITPSISPGFYLQCEIFDVLKWAKNRTSVETANAERRDRSVAAGRAPFKKVKYESNCCPRIWRSGSAEV